MITLAPLATTSNQWLTTGLFLVVVALTLYITFWASQNTRTAGGPGSTAMMSTSPVGQRQLRASTCQPSPVR